mgnify:CR=1 FL=1
MDILFVARGILIQSEICLCLLTTSFLKSRSFFNFSSTSINCVMLWIGNHSLASNSSRGTDIDPFSFILCNNSTILSNFPRTSTLKDASSPIKKVIKMLLNNLQIIMCSMQLLNQDWSEYFIKWKYRLQQKFFETPWKKISVKFYSSTKISVAFLKSVH